MNFNDSKFSWDFIKSKSSSQNETIFKPGRKDHLQVAKDHLQVEKDHLQIAKDHLQVAKDHLQVAKDHLQVEKEANVTTSM